MPPADATQTASLLGPFGLGGVVTTPYGAPTAVGPTAGKPHPGVDIGGLPMGTAIPAFVGGIVTKVYRDAIGGNQVEVTTPEGFRQIYAHLITQNVTVGQTVTGNDTIGFLGNTGTVTGPHLHYEVRQPGGGTIDPQLFLSEFLGGGGPVSSPAGQPPAIDLTLPGDKSCQAGFHLQEISVGPVRYNRCVPDANPVSALVPALGTALGWITNGQNWTKLGLTVVGAGLVVGGVILYTRPSAAAEVARAA